MEREKITDGRVIIYPNLFIKLGRVEKGKIKYYLVKIIDSLVLLRNVNPLVEEDQIKIMEFIEKVFEKNQNFKKKGAYSTHTWDNDRKICAHKIVIYRIIRELPPKIKKKKLKI